ncbi:MAG TPA: prolyl oligopeptidase family serine peptidase [Firmicutes bacterium]|nr:prolyl oligopeptidase family serine peptidase [Bacillota bacterium]
MGDLWAALKWALEGERASKDSGRYKEMMLNYVEAQTAHLTKNAASYLTREKWPTRRLEVRDELLKSLGLDPLPSRTPLNARLVGVIEGDDYVLEKLIFEPRPWFLAPAQLYIPKNADFPAPAVLYSVGHWMVNGKMEPDVHACCVGLAKLGFVVFIYDPIGQGERGCSFNDHGHRDLLLLGLSQAGLMVWESIRAIDYLLTRPEIDGNRIGMTGASGGGLNTLYTSAIDDRIAVSIPVCYVTSFSRFLHAMRGLDWNGGIDLCNQVPNVIKYADMAGICALIAPRALMFINGTEDPQFPIEGTREVLDQVRYAYESLGASDRVTMAAVESGHGYNRNMREAAYGWFKKWLMGEGDGSPIAEPEFPKDAPDDPQFKSFMWGTTISSGPAITKLVKDLARKLPPSIELPQKGNDWPNFREKLKDELRSVLGLGSLSGKLKVIKEEQYDTDDELVAERFILEPEGEIFIPCYGFRPIAVEGNIGEVIVLLNDRGKLAAVDEGIFKLIKSQRIYAFALDLRGTGETAPIAPEYRTLATTEGTLEIIRSKPDDTLEFEVATNCIMLGRSVLAQQVQDLIAFLNYLDNGANRSPTKVTVAASGIRTSLAALFAAALDDRIGRVILDGLLLDYKSVIGIENAAIPIGAYIFGILRHFDLPYVAMLVAPRQLIINRSVDATGAEVNLENIKKVYGITKDIYRVLGCSEAFQMKSEPFANLLKLEFCRI